MFLAYLIVIALSLSGMASILGSKIFEMKTGRLGVFSKWGASADPLVRRKIAAVNAWRIHLNKANAEKVLRRGAHGLFHIFGTAGLFISKYYDRFTSWVRGRKPLKKGGVVSFFLKNVSEHADERKNQE